MMQSHETRCNSTPYEFSKDDTVHLFTPQEASRLLPDVKSKVSEIMEKKKIADSLKVDIERYNLIGHEVSDAKDKNGELEMMVRDLMRKICELEDFGVIIRDLELGLIDFPAERFGEKVFLCWKYGETDIDYWHSASEGFASRKQLRVTVTPP